MPINLRTPVVETREQRLGTITQWEGSARQLARDSAFTYGCAKGCDADKRGLGGRRLCESATPFSQASMCAEHIAVTNATIIQRSVVVQHAPIGCAASQSFTCRYYRDLAARRGWELEDPKSICTNLGEQDMVFGGIERLEETIREAFERHKPRVVFVATSCATGIIGDDVDGAARRIEAEIGVPVVTLHCEGFKSKHWSNGWDVIEHGILRRLVPTAPAKQPDLINDIRAHYRTLADGVGAEVAFIEDGHLARQYVLDRRTDGELPIVFGSTWENALAQQLGAPLVEIGYPCTDEVVLSRAYVGYRGALALIERTYTTVVRANTLA